MHVSHSQIPRSKNMYIYPTRINIGFLLKSVEAQLCGCGWINNLHCLAISFIYLFSGKYYILILWCHQSRHSKGSLGPKRFLELIGCSLLHKEKNWWGLGSIPFPPLSPPPWPFPSILHAPTLVAQCPDPCTDKAAGWSLRAKYPLKQMFSKGTLQTKGYEIFSRMPSKFVATATKCK